MPATDSATDREAGLELDRVTVRFGGVTAVDALTLDAPPGRITGLIGPNGAGKTSTFAACSGLTRVQSGRIRLFGHDVTSRSPQHRAQLGMARTFQRMELFDSLRVEENVALGREAVLAGSNPLKQLRSGRRERNAVAHATDEALRLCGLLDLRRRRVGDLSTGQRRLVELARSVATDCALLLLDEPTSGLDRTETNRLGDILRDLVDQRDVGILLVEHDMSLVMAICDYIYVLDFGRQIFAGTADEVADSIVVRAAYLGDDRVDGEVA
jgi:ABC-type branched-subunit amino acid transport system ATPase component